MLICIMDALRKRFILKFDPRSMISNIFAFYYLLNSDIDKEMDHGLKEER